ncbi:MAG: GTP pyrophosphokinase family protein [Clostridia bacterium]|nr:GTP pyrophosphokinase family protein [Clostridia bacterium]
MKLKERESMDLIDLKNFLDYNKKIKKEDQTFQKLMFIYEMAIKELSTKIEIIKEEYKFLYDYDLIDHVSSRIKKPESILQKMKDKECKLTYKEMIENINDIAGIRIIIPLKKDIFSVRNLLQKLLGIQTIKEKDYITNPKKSGYSAYHIILGVPIVLAQQLIYVKVEVQIRTMAMDFWSNLEHKMKYKPKEEPDKKTSKEWVNYAKMVNKLEHKMML